MTKTLAQRAPLYDSVADLQVSTETDAPGAVADRIAAWLEKGCE